MNIAARLKNIEQMIVKKRGKQEMIVLTEYNGKYYIEKGGKRVETEKPDGKNPDKLIVILKSYSDDEMQKDIK